MDAGVRAAFMVSARAARMMVPRKRGLIVNISHWAAQKRIGNTIYGISKAATDKLTADTARELDAARRHRRVALPGMVRTEAVLAAAEWLRSVEQREPRVHRPRRRGAGAGPSAARADRVLVVAAALAQELGVADVDGRQPVPLDARQRLSIPRAMIWVRLHERFLEWRGSSVGRAYD